MIRTPEQLIGIVEQCFYVTLLFSNGRLNKSSPANVNCFKPWELIPICRGSLLVVLHGPLGPVVAVKQHRVCRGTGSGLLQNWDELLLFKCMLTTKKSPRVSVCIHFTLSFKVLIDLSKIKYSSSPGGFVPVLFILMKQLRSVTMSHFSSSFRTSS